MTAPLLPTDRLEAFGAVAVEMNFTRAAKHLGITQSAVSQRVQKLEEQLDVTLFVRRHGQAELTTEGETLLQYLRARERMETEMLSSLFGKEKDHMRGVLRIGGYSSVTRSVLLPAISPLVRPAEDLVIHLFSRELRELPSMLRSGEADLIITLQKTSERGLSCTQIGTETNVLVEPKTGTCRDCFLDHDPDDTTTADFFEVNGRAFDGKRTYMDDIYGILDGVSAGWGRAVVSSHLLAQFKSIRRVRGFKALVTPVYMVQRNTRYQSRLHREVAELLKKRCSSLLKP